MNTETTSKHSMWIPERSFGVCIYFTKEGQTLTDGDGVLCAEGIVGDNVIEKRVLEAGKYWTSEDNGYVQWAAAAEKFLLRNKKIKWKGYLMD